MSNIVIQGKRASDRTKVEEIYVDAEGGMHINAAPFIVAVSASDVTEYDPPLQGFRVGSAAGQVVVVSNGSVVTIPNVQIGETIEGAITQVYASTAATGIIGWQR